MWVPKPLRLNIDITIFCTICEKQIFAVNGEHNTVHIDHECMSEREQWINEFMHDSDKLKNAELDGWDEKSINGYKSAITALECSLKKILSIKRKRW